MIFNMVGGYSGGTTSDAFGYWYLEFDEGATVTVKNGSTSATVISGLSWETGAIYKIPSSGTWTATATLNGSTKSESETFSTQGEGKYTTLYQDGDYYELYNGGTGESTGWMASKYEVCFADKGTYLELTGYSEGNGGAQTAFILPKTYSKLHILYNQISSVNGVCFQGCTISNINTGAVYASFNHCESVDGKDTEFTVDASAIPTNVGLHFDLLMGQSSNCHAAVFGIWFE